MTDLLAGAVVVGAVILGLVKMVNDFIEGDFPKRRRVIVCLVIGIGAIQLVAHSDFGATQTILGLTLDAMNLGSQLVVGILAAAAASAGWAGLGAVLNIGENQRDAIDVPSNVTSTVHDFTPGAPGLAGGAQDVGPHDVDPASHSL